MVYVRGKMEPPHHALYVAPNSKPSRPLNRRQSDLQETSIYQPCPPTMEVLVELLLWGPQLLIFWNKNRKLLEMDTFLSSHTYLGVGKQQNLGRKKLRTIGDALNPQIPHPEPFLRRNREID